MKLSIYHGLDLNISYSITTYETVNQRGLLFFLCPKLKIFYRKSVHKYKKVLDKTLPG